LQAGIFSARFMLLCGCAREGPVGVPCLSIPGPGLIHCGGAFFARRRPPVVSQAARLKFTFRVLLSLKFSRHHPLDSPHPLATFSSSGSFPCPLLACRHASSRQPTRPTAWPVRRPIRSP
jgi:hypothetical protein